MPQNRESGAAGAEYGHRMAQALTKLLVAEKIASGSNEVVWQGRRAVIKSCRPRTSSFGVTATMLPRLDSVLAALEDDDGIVQVWELDAGKFRQAMRDSLSVSAAGGKVKLVSRAYALAEGRLRAKFTKQQIDEAAIG